MPKDLKEAFTILGVGTRATRKEVKAAFRKRARFFHPDRVANSPDMKEIAEQEMKRLNAAYQMAIAAFDRKAARKAAKGKQSKGQQQSQRQPTGRRGPRPTEEWQDKSAWEARQAREAWEAEKEIYRQQASGEPAGEEEGCLSTGCGGLVGVFVMFNLIGAVLSNCG